MRHTVRLASAIAFSRDPRQRWRQVSVVLAASIAACVCLLTIALPMAATGSLVRGQERGAHWDPDLAVDPGEPVPDGASVAIVQRASVVDGQQIPTVWISPLPGHEDDREIIPVGLDELPEPGEAVLSPALLREGLRAEDFGWNRSSAGSGPNGSIGSSGLMTSSERLIYVRPADERSLGSGPAVWFSVGFIQRLGGAHPAVEGSGAYFTTDPETLSPVTTLVGALCFLLIPALVLLVSSVRARSGLRADRLSLMVTFGIRSTVARMTLACETGLLAAVGVVLAFALSPLIEHYFRHIPATRIVLSPGSLACPWWGYLTAGILVIGVAGGCGSLGRLDPQGQRGHVRGVQPVGTILFIVALACLVLSGAHNPLALVLPPREAQSILLAVGTLGATVTVPFAIPPLVALVARGMSSSRKIVVWAVGKRLRFDAVHLSRVASTLGVLIVVLSSATALWGSSAIATMERPVDESRASARSVSWRDPQAGDFAQVQQHLDALGIDGIALPVVTSTEEREAPSVVVQDCDRFVDIIGGAAKNVCADKNDQAAYVARETGMKLAADEPVDGAESGTVMVVSRKPVAVPLLQQALGFLPGVNIDVQPADLPGRLPLHEWIMSGALAALVLLGVAVLREVGDQSIEDGARDAHLMRLGLSTRTAEVLGAMLLLVPLGVGVLTAFIASVFIAYGGETAQLMSGDRVPLAIVATTALLIAAGAVVVAGPARRAARRE